MRLSRLLLTAAICVLALAVAWLGWLWGIGAFGYAPLVVGQDEATPIGYPWLGAVHVHTELSADATGTLEEIVSAAEANGLDFVVIADHTGSLGTGGRAEGGWMGGSDDDPRVLVVVGEEISTDSGHLLALGIRPHPYALGPTAAQALRDIRELGGTAFIAHPDGGEASWRAGWGSAVGGEIASLSSALAVASRWRLLGAALTYPVNPDAAMVRFAEESWTTLESWDDRTAAGERRAGIGSVDAHGPLRGTRFPSYGAAFRALAVVTWLPEPPPRIDPAARRSARATTTELVDALIAGRAATIVPAAGRAGGLFVAASNEAGRRLAPGEVADIGSGPWSLAAALGEPGPYRIDLVHDGVVVATAEGAALEHGLEYRVDVPGAYRVSVYRTDIDSTAPWIVSNPIYLWPDHTIAASRIRPVPPLPAPAIDQDLLPLTGWAAEADETSRSAMAPGAGGLVWELRMPNVVAEDRYAAVVWRPEEATDWSRSGGLVAQLRSAEPWRVSLRVWTRDDEGAQRTWERVLPTGPVGERSAAPWSLFRRIDRPGEPIETGIPTAELMRVEGVAFVVTPQRMRPGREAQIAIEAIGRFGGD